MKRVTGLGGIFFKCQDPENIKLWYQTHLGFEISPWGTQFDDKQNSNAYTVWSPFKADTDYFNPSTKEFMINFRVENLEALVQVLLKEGVQFLDQIESYEGMGKFVHLLDPEGNKIELWEPAV
jgi:predicted enzyme related to lactoylglutathione lyase